MHSGHLKHIAYMKNELNAERVIVIMSGNFTQRGECAVMNKFLRAKQAVIAGADLVIELPTVFATANAETFAKGAIKIINSLGVVDGICFGVESGTADEYKTLARALNDESKEYKKALKEKLEQGVSLAKAKFEALKQTSDGAYNENLIASPNNVLGLEYTKALLKLGSNIEIYPMLREGDHNSVKLEKDITSATSIRAYLKSGKKNKIKKYLPKHVFNDLKEYPFAFDKMILSKAITVPAEKMSRVPDCTEGLEHRIKALIRGNTCIETLINKVSTKRYTSSRISRILTANFLDITQELVDDCLKDALYAKVLAVNSDCKDLLAQITNTCSYPVLTRKSDCDALKKTAQGCFEKDALANDLYNLATGENENEYYTHFV